MVHSMPIRRPLGGLPWRLREGIVIGVREILGAMLMYFIVWVLIAKFALLVVVRWPDQRPAHP